MCSRNSKRHDTVKIVLTFDAGAEKVVEWIECRVYSWCQPVDERYRGVQGHSIHDNSDDNRLNLLW